LKPGGYKIVLYMQANIEDKNYEVLAMINLYVWIGFFFAALLGCLLLKHELAGPKLVVASLFGIVVRITQFIALALIVVFAKGLAFPRLIVGFGITSLLLLGFISLPFLRPNKQNARLVSAGLFFYLGYTLAGFVLSYLVPRFV
jgi:hypothetical protein